MNKKKLRPYIAPHCTIIVLDNMPTLMSGSGSEKPVIPPTSESPAATMDIDPWKKGISDRPNSDTETDPTDEEWGDWLN